MQRSAYNEISDLVNDLLHAGISSEVLEEALQKVAYDVPLRMSSFKDPTEDQDDEDFENMPV